MDDFQVTFKNGIVFKQMIEVCKDIVQDVNIYFSRDGIELNSMDMAHVALVHLFISKKMFTSYSLTRATKISVSLKHLFSILKCMKEKYELILSYKSNHKLKIVMNSSDKKSYTFELCLFQMEDNPMVPPEATPDACFTMESSSFSDILKNMSNVLGGSNVTIEAKNEYCLFKTSGDVGSVEYMELLETMHCVNHVKMQFSLKYLHMFAKASLFHENVDITLFQDEPLQLRYGVQGKCFLQFFLAPRFDDADL